MLASAGAVNVPSLPNVQMLVLLAVRLALTPTANAESITEPSSVMAISFCSAVGPLTAVNVLVNLPGIRLVSNFQPSADQGVASVSNCAKKP